MTRHFLAYATANESWRFHWDALNFRRLAACDPGVPEVDVYIAVSEVRPRGRGEAKVLAALRAILEANPRYRIRELHYKPNVGRDFSSWRWCLSRILETAGPADYVLCLNRSAYGPTRDGWYAAFVKQFARDPQIGLCGASINFGTIWAHERREPVPGPQHTHVQSYTLFARPHVLAQQFEVLPGVAATSKEDAIINGEIRLSRQFLQAGLGISCLAWPDRVFFEKDAYDPELPQSNISLTLTSTPFRHWNDDDYRRARNPIERFRWLFELRRLREGSSVPE